MAREGLLLPGEHGVFPQELKEPVPEQFNPFVSPLHSRA